MRQTREEERQEPNTVANIAFSQIQRAKQPAQIQRGRSLRTRTEIDEI